MTLLIKNGHVLDPATETDEEIDIFIEDGKIAKRGKKLKCKAERVIAVSYTHLDVYKRQHLKYLTGAVL